MEGLRAAATDGKESSTNVQGDVTDITDQPDDLVETEGRFRRNATTTNLGDGKPLNRKRKSL